MIINVWNIIAIIYVNISGSAQVICFQGYLSIIVNTDFCLSILIANNYSIHSLTNASNYEKFYGKKSR